VKTQYSYTSRNSGELEFLTASPWKLVQILQAIQLLHAICTVYDRFA